MNKALLWVVVAVVVVGGGLYVYNNWDAAEQDAATNPAGTVEEGTPMPEEGNPDVVGGDAEVNGGVDADVDAVVSPIKSFTVTASSFKFSPAEMRVEQGDTVRVTLVNSGGSHDWKLDEFNAATRVLQSGESQTIEFVATRAGSFEYYCSIGTHRQMGMKGMLIVQ